MSYENWDNLKELVTEMSRSGIIPFETCENMKKLIDNLCTYFKVVFSQELQVNVEEIISWINTYFLISDPDSESDRCTSNRIVRKELDYFNYSRIYFLSNLHCA